MNEDKSLSFPSRFFLVVILCLAFFIRIYNLHYNSPFIDEALYIVLGREVWQGTWENGNPFSWVGGFPLLYPPLTAAFNVFGIVGSRFLNVVLGTVAVYWMYYFAKNLSLAGTKQKNELVGLFAGLFLAVLTIPIYLSRLAIYDMLSFTLFLAGIGCLQTGLLTDSSSPIKREKMLVIASGLLFLSFLAKYVTLSFFPFIALWAAYTAWKINPNVLSLAIRYFIIPLFAGTGLYILWHFSDLRSFSSSQIATSTVVATEVVGKFLRYAFIPFAGALIGWFTLPSGRQRKIGTLLCAAALIIPVTHVMSHNTAAVHQHAFLSIIFLLPLVGYLFVYILSIHRAIGIVSIGAAAALTMVFSSSQLRPLEAEWPNSDQATAYLQQHMSPQETLLSFEDDVAVLALPDSDPEHIVGNFYFEYQDLSATPAYQKALADGYFDWILFNENSTDDPAPTVREVLPTQFTEVFRDDPLVLYRKK